VVGRAKQPQGVAPVGDGGGEESAGGDALVLDPIPVDVRAVSGLPKGPAKRDKTPPPRGRSGNAKLLADAGAAMRRGDAAAAARMYRQVVRRSPSSAAAQAGLGQAEFQLGNNASAARHFERAVQLRPGNNRYRILYAGVLVRLGRRAEARSQYQAVLQSDPDHAVAGRMLERL
jgi:predicted Zn-dependent protease